MQRKMIALGVGEVLGLSLLAAPYFARKLRGGVHPAASLAQLRDLSYAQLLRDRDALSYYMERLRRAGKTVTRENVAEILQELPRHNSFAYINSGSLPEQYFKQAAKTLYNGYLYLVITQSKNAASEIIGVFTNKQYNHVSLSFDPELHTIISYNGGEKLTPPGLNPELVEQLTRRDGASVLLYRLPATARQKRLILEQIRTINQEGSAYNLFGLFFKVSHQPNIMFCSQFVYRMLELAELNYFEKDAAHVRPTDFVELDYDRALEFVGRIGGRSPSLSRVSTPALCD